MYYKGITMDEIQKYLTEELQSAKEEKENLEEQIHKIEIETELICRESCCPLKGEENI